MIAAEECPAQSAKKVGYSVTVTGRHMTSPQYCARWSELPRVEEIDGQPRQQDRAPGDPTAAQHESNHQGEHKRHPTDKEHAGDRDHGVGDDEGYVGSDLNLAQRADAVLVAEVGR